MVAIKNFIRVSLPLRRCLCGLALLSVFGLQSKAQESQGARNPWLRPFSEKSIWNTSIGQDAILKPVSFPGLQAIDPEHEFIYEVTGPVFRRAVYQFRSWRQRTATTNQIGEIPISDFLMGSKAADPYHPNACAALLLNDRQSVRNLTAFSRFSNASAVYCSSMSEWNLFEGDGLDDGRVASGMSILGGAIRVDGENDLRRIPHALKMTVNTKWLYKNADGFRWPAIRTGVFAATKYKGQDESLKMGALLTLPKDFKEKIGDLKTTFARSLATAIYEYGIYIVDESTTDAIGICMTREAEQAVAGLSDLPDDESVDSFHAPLLQEELLSIFGNLHVVVDNTPESIGGRGERRAVPELPEPIAKEDFLVDTGNYIPIYNGSMTDGFTMPDEWKSILPDRMLVKTKRDLQEFYSPPASLWLKSIESKQNASVTQYSVFNSQRSISISAVIRVKGQAKAQLRAKTGYRNTNVHVDELIGEVDQLETVNAETNGEWIPIHKEINFEDRIRGMRFEFSIEGDGEAWLDDVVAVWSSDLPPGELPRKLDGRR